MLSFAVLLVALGAAQAERNWNAEFSSYVQRFNKTYGAGSAANGFVDEMSKRKEIYIQNKEYIEAANINLMARNASYRLGENDLTDMSRAEFERRLTSRPPAPTGLRYTASYNGNETSNDLYAINWVNRDAVGRVKNQQQCGSCWAFSAMGAIYGQNAILNKDYTELSEQQQVDCNSKCNGCGGGLMSYAFDFAARHGTCSEAEYPYDAEDDTCKKCSKSPAKVIGYYDVSKNRQSVKSVLHSEGPLSIAIAVATDLQFYTSGIFDGACASALNHGVLLVGYETNKDGEEYWLIKNSWGHGWGERGYFRFPVDLTGKCGMYESVNYPIVARGQSSGKQYQHQA